MVEIHKLLVVGGRSTATVPMYCLLADYFRREDRPTGRIAWGLNSGTSKEQ